MIQDRVIASPAFCRADALITYLAHGSEVETRAIVGCALRAGKLVALPRVMPGARRMEFIAVRSLAGLVEGTFGIMEPAPDAAEPVDGRLSTESLAIVPGLVFDRSGFRVGYGGGYYDSYLASFPGTTLGLCRSAFLLDRFSPGIVEPHDRSVDLIASERGLIGCARFR